MTPPIGGVLTTNVYLGVEMFTTNCMNTAGHVWTVIDYAKKILNVKVCNFRADIKNPSKELLCNKHNTWSQLPLNCVRIL